jgi:hypothetical protein
MENKIEFVNGLIIKGSPKITKTLNGIRIINDLGLDIELSDLLWNILTNNNGKETDSSRLANQ